MRTESHVMTKRHFPSKKTSRATSELCEFGREDFLLDSIDERNQVQLGAQGFPADAVEQSHAIAANGKQRVVDSEVGQRRAARCDRVSAKGDGPEPEREIFHAEISSELQIAGGDGVTNYSPNDL